MVKPNSCKPFQINLFLFIFCLFLWFLTASAAHIHLPVLFHDRWIINVHVRYSISSWRQLRWKLLFLQTMMQIASYLFAYSKCFSFSSFCSLPLSSLCCSLFFLCHRDINYFTNWSKLTILQKVISCVLQRDFQYYRSMYFLYNLMFPV